MLPKSLRHSGFFSLVAVFAALAVLVLGLYLFFGNSNVSVPISPEIGTPVRVSVGQTVQFDGEDLAVTLVSFADTPCVTEGSCGDSGRGAQLKLVHAGEIVAGTNVAKAFGFEITITDTDFHSFATIIVSRAKAEDVVVAPPRKTYTNPAGFSVTYPTDIMFRVEPAGSFVPGPGGAPVSGEKLEYVAPIKHCNTASSTDCTDTSVNISIGFFVINQSFSSFIAPIRKAFPKDMGTFVIASSTVDSLTLPNVQGVRVSLYFVPLEGRTLMIERRLIDESLAHEYVGGEGFLPLATSQEVFGQIIQSFVVSTSTKP